ncbi:MAG: hypothetical protein IPI44_20635 [Sulfuritalea sp.]|nr:hypothetical protein [Sulfuritalea sp.]
MTLLKSSLTVFLLALSFAGASHAETFGLLVAEPGEWALFLSGIGLIGLMLARSGR